MGCPGAPGLLSSPRSFLRSFRPVSRPSPPDSEYSASCLFPFALPRFASHSCSAGAHLSLSLRCSPLLPLPFVRFHFRLRLLGLPFLPFPIFPVLPHGGFSGTSVSAFASPASPSVPPGFPWCPSGSSVLSFPFVSFRPSLLRLPRLFHRCSPFGLPPALLPCLRFLSSASALGSDYSAFCFFLSLHPRFPSQWFPGCPFIRFPRCLLPCTRFRFGTQPCCDFPSPVSLPRVTAATTAPGLLPFGFRPSP